MKKLNKKKGFTIVELVIVIAVVGVLTAVLVPTFVNLANQARRAENQTFVKNLNTQMAIREATEGKNKTMYEAIKEAEDIGFNVEKLTPFDGNDIVWDSVANRFAIVGADYATKKTVVYADGEIKATSIHQLWKAYDSMPSDQTYSIYAKDGWDMSVLDTAVFKVGFDPGKNSTANRTVTYDRAESFVASARETLSGKSPRMAPEASQEVRIRTTGGEMKIGSATSTARGEIRHYGTLDGSTAYLADGFVTHGVVQNMELKAGKAIAGSNGVLYLNKAEAGTEAAEEDDGVVIIPTKATSNDIKTSSLPAGYVVTETGTTQPANIASKIAANQGLMGSGTEADPFQVYNRETMQAISMMYDSGYKFFKVNKALTDNGKIDCTGWVPVKLHGSFNGTGVKFTNVTACLFQIVGYQLQNENILLENFDATMNVSSNGQYGAAALIKNIFNAGVTTFQKVNVHGHLEGFWNMGSFYNYGTANYDDVGSDYEVVFNDCYSDATLVCASGNTIGGLFGHAFEGLGHSFTLRVNNTEYVGQMFLTTTSGKGNKYYGMTSDYYNSHNHFYFNGVEDTFDNGNSKNAGAYTNSTKITEVKATKSSNGYVVEKQTNVSKIVVTITAQLTAYDENDVKITNLSGITMTLSSKELTELDGSSIKVLDLFNSTNITKNASKYDASVSNSILNIKLASSANYKSGNIRLQVNQYDSTGLIVSAGTVDLVVSKDANSDWIIK